MVSFDTISNLYDAKSIAECYDETITGDIPGIKDELGSWNIKGHPGRVIHVTEEELAMFANLFDGTDSGKQAKLPAIHAQTLVDVLECFARQKQTVGSLKDAVLLLNVGMKRALRRIKPSWQRWISQIALIM